MSSVADLALQSFMIDTSVFAAEVVQEVLEEMLIVRVGTLYGCVGAQVLV